MSDPVFGEKESPKPAGPKPPSVWGALGPGQAASQKGHGASARPPADAERRYPWTPGQQPEELLEPAFAPAYREYARTKSPEAADKLLAAVRPVVDEALRSYAGGESATATARARAKRLTLEAVGRYDPTRAKLRTHLLSHLRGLRRLTERGTAGVYVPEQTKLDARAVRASEAELSDTLGREPSDAEVADHAKIPLARVRKARAAPGVLAGSQLDSQIAISTPDERAWNAWVDAVYHDLGPVDQVILERGFGLHGKKPLPANEVAALVGLSPGAISQRSTRIQQMLDEYDLFLRGRGAT